MTAATDVEVHMPFCDGRRHGPDEEFDWDCVHVIRWTDSAGDRASAWIQGVHGDSVRVDYEAGLYDPEDIDPLVAALADLRPLLAVARPFANCYGCEVCNEDNIDG